MHIPSPSAAPGLRVLELGSHSLKAHEYRHGSLVTQKARYNLGHEVYTRGLISRATLERVAAFLDRATDLPTLAVGTSAVRDAENARDLVEVLELRAGIELRVLSRHDEALLLAEGFRATSEPLPALVADLGGGSLQAILIGLSGLLLWDSLPLGAIRLHHQVYRNAPGSEDPWIDRAFEEACVARAEHLYVTGGTVKAATRCVGRDTVTPGELDALYGEVRRDGPPAGLRPDRARIFPAGLAVLRRFARFVGAERVSYLDVSIGRVLCALAANDERPSVVAPSPATVPGDGAGVLSQKEPPA